LAGISFFENDLGRVNTNVQVSPAKSPGLFFYHCHFFHPFVAAGVSRLKFLCLKRFQKISSRRRQSAQIGKNYEQGRIIVLASSSPAAL
jgi:hypothetical protein